MAQGWGRTGELVHSNDSHVHARLDGALWARAEELVHRAHRGQTKHNAGYALEGWLGVSHVTRDKENGPMTRAEQGGREDIVPMKGVGVAENTTIRLAKFKC